jgi:hypothetical protein
MAGADYDYVEMFVKGLHLSAKKTNVETGVAPSPSRPAMPMLSETRQAASLPGYFDCSLRRCLRALSSKRLVRNIESSPR